MRLVYQADVASGCPDAESLTAGVIGRLGRDPFAADAARRVEVTVTTDGPVRRARIAIVEGDVSGGERHLESRQATCTELAEELEFAVALAIDPSIPRPAATTPSAPAALAPPPAQPPLAAERGPAATVATAPAPTVAAARTAFELGVLVADGTAPGRTAGIAGLVRRELGAWSLGGEARLDRAGGRTLTFSYVEGGLVAFSAVGCRHDGPLLLCALASAGRLTTRGEGLTGGDEGATPYVALGGRVEVGRPLGPIWLALHADAQVATTRTELVVDDAVVWTSARVPLALGLRVGAPL